MESRWTILIITVLALFVIIYFFGHTFMTGKSDIRTETAYAYDITDDIPFEGVYLRTEEVIYSTGTGVLSYQHEDSAKVGKSSVVAYRYRNEGDIDINRRIDDLDEQIAVLREAEKLIGTDNSQLDTITSQINMVHSSLVDMIVSKDYTAAAEYESRMLEALSKREIAKGESSGYSEKISLLEQERTRLKAQLSGDVQTIYANSTGYFVSDVDGYEDKLTFDSADTITADKIEEIVANPDISSGGNAVGKLIADYTWRVAAVLDSTKLFGVYEGSTVNLRVGSQNTPLKAKVVAVNDTKRGDNTAVYVFECDRLNSAVVGGRTAHFKLAVSSYGGLRVPRAAIRLDEQEQRGVFVVRGSSLVFKKINVIYWAEDYVICSQEADDSYLKLYDEIVTEGKDLHDGRVIE
ncbi:MAG: HlyD family efflux transporter periplasmic adaptor subunit [Oscillospiraceae bacterium]